MTTSPHLTATPSGDQLILFREGSRASRSALPASVKARKMTVSSGRKCLELLKRFSQATSWAKTLSAFFLLNEAWYSKASSLTWQVRATKSGLLYCQLQVSEPHTNATVSGLLPTATAQDFKRRGPNSKQQGLSNVENWSGMLPTPRANKVQPTLTPGVAARNKGNLEEAIASMLYPTPTASLGEVKNGNYLHNANNDDTCKAYRELYQGGLLPTPTSTRFSQQINHAEVGTDGRTKPNKLGWAVTKLLPTPRLSDYKGCGPVTSNSCAHQAAKGYLEATIKADKGLNGHLSPLFVEEMMGFPIGYTDPGLSNEEVMELNAGYAILNGWPMPNWDQFPNTKAVCTPEDGIRKRPQRLKQLGNAIVPQLAYQFFMFFKEHENSHQLAN